MLIAVAVPVPTLGLLTYRVPHDIDPPSIGARVVVPLGARSVTGIVVEQNVAGDAGGKEVRAIRRVLDVEPFVPADVVALAAWTAEYYGAGAGETITAVLPPPARGERVDAHKTRRIVSLTAAGLELLDTGTPKQKDILAVIAGSATGVPAPELTTRGISAGVVARLLKQGLVSIRQERVERDPFESSALRTPDVEPLRRLTLEQDAALTRLTALAATKTFRTALLHGVTGSGKTEIYMRLAQTVRASGRNSLILVPEIALTPSVAASFRQMFGDEVAIQHSALSVGERYDQWQRIRRGESAVVIGTRSAVFAPLPALGLIVVDEEHDSSYKQEESPRYNGRDVAIVRAQQAGALVVLGSATPSMESYYHAVNGKYEHVVLNRRVLDRPLAEVRIVDMREEYALEGPEVILSRALKEGIAARLSRHEQALVLLNRRGFATAVFCRQCGGTLDCPNCSVSLVIHGEGQARRARCHYCNYTARVETACPACKAPYLEQMGFGTEKVEAELKKLFPQARTARLDRDSIRQKGSLANLLTRFRDQEIDVLVGTQMIAKGHDFPRVTLVGVISADVGLGMADFRAAERTFQLLTQVAGRAGRGEQRGEAIVQTIYPGHYSIQLACRQDYRAFYDQELKFREAMRYPPSVALTNAIVRGRTFAQAMEDATEIAARVREGDRARRELRVLGPAPAPLGRLRGEYRVQFLLKGRQRKRMRELLMATLALKPEIARRTTVDVDPLSVM